MPRPIRDQVIVITGASSGIGRETAMRAASKGASVVLSGRNEQALREAVEQIERQGGSALATVADVSDFNQVRRLAEQAVMRFGRIDCWVNNAAITLYGTVEQTTPEEFDRIMRVNFLGTVHGCKAAIEQMGRQDEATSTIINVASVEADRGFPLQAAYAASKHAIKGFTEALRLELQRSRARIKLVQVNPAGINTPFFEHGRSRLGALPMPMPPVYDPGLVADTILECASCPPRLVYAGAAGRMFALLQRISPSLVDSMLLKDDSGFKNQVSDQPDPGVDNLDRPMDASTYRSRGRFGPIAQQDDWFTRNVELHPGVGLAVLGGVALGALAVASALSPPGRRAIGSAAHQGKDALDHARHSARRGARDASRWASHRGREAVGQVAGLGGLGAVGSAARRVMERVT